VTIPDCKRCQLYSGSLYLSCTVHPTGPAPNGCLDFAPNAAAAVEEKDKLWFPDRSGWYAGGPVPTPSFTLTIQEQLDLLESHPRFTGCCPQCGWEYDPGNLPAVHWDCPQPDCGWKDDSV
jgi:hypothetical protein